MRIQSRFQALTKASDMPFDCGLAARVRHAIRLRAWANSLVSCAVHALPLFRQMFYCMRCAGCAKALFDGLQPHVSNAGAGHPGIGSTLWYDPRGLGLPGAPRCIAAIKVRFSVNQDETRAGV